MTTPVAELTLTPNYIAIITLNRPDDQNILTVPLIEQLQAHIDLVNQNMNIRAVMLNAQGKSFCAGEDIHQVQQLASLNGEDSTAYAQKLGNLLHSLYTLSVPTLAVVHGSALGAGVGIVAAMDIAVASDNAVFCLPDVRLGLVPSVVAPYFTRAVGLRHTQRYALTAEKFGAAEALRMNLVHEVVSLGELQGFGHHLLRSILDGGAQAQKQAKTMIRACLTQEISIGLAQWTATHLHEAQSRLEAQEGVAAALEKRLPSWRPSSVTSGL